MSISDNFSSFFSLPISNRNQLPPSSFNLLASQPQQGRTAFTMTGGMQFPLAANSGASSLANSIMSGGSWNPGMVLGQGTYVNPFNGYSPGKQPNSPNYDWAGLMSANYEVQILTMLQRFLESQKLFAPDKPCRQTRRMSPPKCPC